MKNITLKKLSSTNRKVAKQLKKSITPVKGMVVHIYYCEDCDHVSGARFIPFAVGNGCRYNLCSCMMTHNTRLNKIHKVRI